MPQIRLNDTIGESEGARDLTVHGLTVREALDSAFQNDPPLRGHVLDADGRLRKHVVVFVDGGMVEDREGLTDPVDHDSELLVMKAL